MEIDMFRTKPRQAQTAHALRLIHRNERTKAWIDLTE